MKGILTTVITAAGNINAITAGRLLNSRVYAGALNPLVGLPSVPADFFQLNPATITKVTVKGITTSNEAGVSFANTDIAAPIIGTISLKDVATNNDDVLFGIAADQVIKSVSRTGQATLKNLTDLGDMTDVDFVLRIV